MGETMSVRMHRENYDFLREISKREERDLSKAVPEGPVVYSTPFPSRLHRLAFPPSTR